MDVFLYFRIFPCAVGHICNTQTHIQIHTHAHTQTHTHTLHTHVFGVHNKRKYENLNMYTISRA